VRVLPNTNTTPIERGEALTVGTDWTTDLSSNQNDTTTLGFNTAIDASAIVYREIAMQGRPEMPEPTYILSSGREPMLRGTYKMIPTRRMMVFFLAQSSGTCFDPAPLGHASITVSYTEVANPTVTIMSDDTFEQGRDGPGLPS
jgi:hypothetical protein